MAKQHAMAQYVRTLDYYRPPPRKFLSSVPGKCNKLRLSVDRSLIYMCQFSHPGHGKGGCTRVSGSWSILTKFIDVDGCWEDFVDQWRFWY